MIDNLKKFLNEEQDPKAVEKVFEKVSGLLTNGEDIKYIAVQKKPAINISPDCIALTNKSIIFCRPKHLGLSMEFEDYLWKDVVDCHMKEGILGAEFSMRSTKGHNKIDYLPKAQARKVYQFAQEKEEEQIEIRRNRELEEKRAAAGGGIVVNTNMPGQTSQSEPSNMNQEDPIEVLKKLKTLLENELITQEEFNSKKSEI